jgi:hypothetical protein
LDGIAAALALLAVALFGVIVITSAREGAAEPALDVVPA